MRIQANYNGAWRSVQVPDSLSVDGESTHAAESHVMEIAAQLAPGAKGLRILSGEGRTLWLWDIDHGWHRPHWFKTEEDAA